jgi:hypothetical protein
MTYGQVCRSVEFDANWVTCNPVGVTVLDVSSNDWESANKDYYQRMCV